MNSILKLLKFYARYIPLKFGIVITRDMPYSKRRRDLKLIAQDYVRSSTLELLAYEIYRRGVKGSVAEFPDRKLYLFDTFEGFDIRDRSFDVEKVYSDATQDFSNTSVSLVLSKMPYKENVVIKKGYFPGSARDVEDSFCLVSIDVDLYLPTKAGLEYFYPRLVKGGYILVHDFNNKEGIPYIPVSDVCGSCIIAK